MHKKNLKSKIWPKITKHSNKYDFVALKQKKQEKSISGNIYKKCKRLWYKNCILGSKGILQNSPYLLTQKIATNHKKKKVFRSEKGSIV